MTDAEIRVRAVIAIGLIQAAKVGGLDSAEDFMGPKGMQLREMVDAVLSAIVNPKREP